MATLSLPTSRPRQQTAPPNTVFSVKAVKPDLIPYWWPFAEPYITRALEHNNGTLLPEDVYHYLLSERMYLFVVLKNGKLCSAVACEIVRYVRKKAIRIVALSSENFDEWKEEGKKELLEWAKRQSCDGVEVYVRKGFGPKLETLGFKQTCIGMWLDGPGLG